MYFKSGFRRRKSHLRELEKVLESGDWVIAEMVSERGMTVERVSDEWGWESRDRGEGEWERCDSGEGLCESERVSGEWEWRGWW